LFGKIFKHKFTIATLKRRENEINDKKTKKTRKRKLNTLVEQQKKSRHVVTMKAKK